MRVVFNVVSTLKPKTGVGHYAARLADALAVQMPVNSLGLFPGHATRKLIRLGQKSHAMAGKPGGAARLAWVKENAKRIGNSSLAAMFRLACSARRFDLYHEPNFIPLAHCVPTIVTVHDLSVLKYPQWHPADRVRRHEAAFRKSLAHSVHVITDSEVIRNEVIDTLGVTPDRVTAIPLGVGREYFSVPQSVTREVRRRYALPAEFLLYVGTLEPRKNLLTLLKAYCSLPSDLRQRCPLVLAGGWGWQAEPIADYLYSVAQHQHVRHLGYVPDADLPGLYSAARALVFPSHYEGFGLPPLEMLATGGAVIASTAGVHREVLGNHAIFIAPDDTDGWRNGLRMAITNHDWLNTLRHGGSEYAAGFTWQQCATDTVAVYSKVQSEKLAA